jgi:hypothetical protein
MMHSKLGLQSILLLSCLRLFYSWSAVRNWTWLRGKYSFLQQWHIQRVWISYGSIISYSWCVISSDFIVNNKEKPNVYKKLERFKISIDIKGLWVIHKVSFIGLIILSIVWEVYSRVNYNTTWVRQPFVTVSIPCIIHHSNVLSCVLSQHKLTRRGISLGYIFVCRRALSLNTGMDTFWYSPFDSPFRKLQNRVFSRLTKYWPRRNLPSTLSLNHDCLLF